MESPSFSQAKNRRRQVKSIFFLLTIIFLLSLISPLPCRADALSKGNSYCRYNVDQSE